jgi:hypothetical protein
LLFQVIDSFLKIDNPMNCVVSSHSGGTLKTQLRISYFMAMAAVGLFISGCISPPANIAIRRIEINGDDAEYIGHQLVDRLQSRGARISESIEHAPVLTGTSTVQKLADGVEVFTLELTDGSGLKTRAVVSTQDLPPLTRDRFIPEGIDLVVDDLIKKLEPKLPPPSPSETKKPEHYRSS